MSNETPFFLMQNEGFTQARPEDELLHPDRNALVLSHSATETQYFGFNIPAAGINALGYMWHHSKLHTITGGLLAWKGIKPSTNAAELTDMHDFMSDEAIRNDLHEYRLDNGYGVKVIEPLTRHHVTYVDATRGNEVDLHYDAVCPPVMFGDGNHFEQPMRVRGTVVLRGVRHQVDGYHVRDRSWGKARPENNVPMPPSTWVTGVFNDEFAFNCACFDAPPDHPELRGTSFELPADKTVTSGWIYRKGKLRRVVAARKRVERDLSRLLTHRVDFEMTDDLGEITLISGTLLASLPWAYWPTMHDTMSLMRWECDGLVGYGDCQDVFWNDYLVEFLK